MKIGQIGWLAAVAVCVAGIPNAVGSTSDCETDWTSSTASQNCSASNITASQQGGNDICKFSSLKCQRANHTWNSLGDRTYMLSDVDDLVNCNGNIQTGACPTPSSRYPCSASDPDCG